MFIDDYIKLMVIVKQEVANYLGSGIHRNYLDHLDTLNIWYTFDATFLKHPV